MGKKYKWQLTPLAVASIGAIDDFFDLYTEIQSIYDAVRDARIAERGNLNNYFPDTWNKEARKQVRKAAEPILIKYYPIFLDGEHKIHANAYGFERFDFIKATLDDNHKRYLFKCHYISFANFLIEIQKAITRIAYRWEVPGGYSEIVFETVRDEINDHIAKYVEKHSLVKTYRAEEQVPQDSCSLLYIYQNLSSVGCRLRQHSIVATTCMADFASGNGKILLPVHFCENCNKYFIGETTLALFEKNYGKVLIKKRKLDNSGDFSALNEESILFQYGYNVSDGQSEDARQKLLVSLLESKRVSYLEMTRCIEFNIRMHPHNQEAVIKWKRDLKYISDYVVQKNL